MPEKISTPSPVLCQPFPLHAPSPEMGQRVSAFQRILLQKFQPRTPSSPPFFLILVGLSLPFLFCRSLVPLVGEGNGTPLQYSCLENPMDGGAWKAAVHGVTKSQT